MFSDHLDFYLDMHQERLSQSQKSYLLQSQPSQRPSFWRRSANWLRLFLA
jgi:hypothetical protein